MAIPYNKKEGSDYEIISLDVSKEVHVDGTRVSTNIIDRFYKYALNFIFSVWGESCPLLTKLESMTLSLAERDRYTLFVDFSNLLYDLFFQASEVEYLYNFDREWLEKPKNYMIIWVDYKAENDEFKVCGKGFRYRLKRYYRETNEKDAATYIDFDTYGFRECNNRLEIGFICLEKEFTSFVLYWMPKVIFSIYKKFMD